MTELEYVLKGFEEKFAAFKGRRILLHGSREYARGIIGRYEGTFHFAGIMSRDPLEGPGFMGLPVLAEEDLPDLEADLIILTERVKYAEAVYQAIHGICETRGIRIFNMYGVDECESHRQIENCRALGTSGWKQLCRSYDIVAFEAMDVFLFERYYTGELAQRYSMRSLALWLDANGKDVRLSLRRSEPEERQLRALSQPPLFEDLERHLIRRQGEDLSFRALREAHPDSRILYIGNGLVNECLLPRCYGIDTYHFRSIDYASRMPVPAAREELPYDADRPERIRRQIREADVVSFDVFDTLLIRRTLYPRDVFLLTEQRAAAEGLAAEDYARLRVRAEEQEGGGNIRDIYERLRGMTGWDRTVTDRLMALELETEKSVILPRREVVDLLDYALGEGREVVLTSDMYLPAPIIEDLLRRAGITGYSRLLVSCDCGRGKKEGLFRELRRPGRDKARILHIGDDREADGACVREGMDFVHLPAPRAMAVSAGWGDSIRAASTLMERCLVGMTLAELFRDPFQDPNLRRLPEEERVRRFAAGCVGPLTVGHMTWMLERIGEGGYDGVLFLARDGYLPLMLYRHLEERYRLPRGIYYYANRHASFLTAADDDKGIQRAVDTGRGFGLDARQILTHFYDLQEEDLLPEREGEEAADYIRRHMPLISRTARDAREGFLRFSEQCGMREGGTYAAVDFIATGTTQTYLERFLPFKLYGFYYGNHNPDDRVSYTITDYLETERDTLMQNFIELECAYISPEPAQDTMTADGHVRFLGEVRTPAELRRLDLLQKTALRCAKDFFDIFYVWGEVIDPRVPEEMFAADGYHYIQTEAYDDWAQTSVASKAWKEHRE